MKLNEKEKKRKKGILISKKVFTIIQVAGAGEVGPRVRWTINKQWSNLWTDSLISTLLLFSHLIDGSFFLASRFVVLFSLLLSSCSSSSHITELESFLFFLASLTRFFSLSDPFFLFFSLRFLLFAHPGFNNESKRLFSCFI